MIDDFFAIYKRLLRNNNYSHVRYLYKTFNITNRLTGLIGPRGTGKTTLLLQFINEHIENKDECIYVSVDNIYFSEKRIIDFVKELYQDYGVRYYFFDEIHKYKNWNQELKNIYDSYLDIKIVFSGSSSIDLIKGAYDLSRRGVLYRIGGMSFREYLFFKGVLAIEPISLEDLLHRRQEVERSVAEITKIKGLFRDYLGKGYYPFLFEDESTYHQKIFSVIEKTIYEDISNFYKLKTENLANFKKIIVYLSTIPPGELNRNNIARHMGLDNKTVQNYLNILNETGLLELLAENKSGSALLKQKEKLYLDNPDIYSAVAGAIGAEIKIGTVREIFFIKMIKNSGNGICYSQTGDFEVNNGILFEIGGKNKTAKQLKGKRSNAYVVKDDILYGTKSEIPLYLFGFLY